MNFLRSSAQYLPDRDTVAFQSAAVLALPSWFPLWGAYIAAHAASEQPKAVVQQVVRQHFRNIGGLWKGMSHYGVSLPLYGLIHHARTKAVHHARQKKQSKQVEVVTLLAIDGLVGATAACVGAPVTATVRLKQKHGLKFWEALRWARNNSGIGSLLRGLAPLSLSNAAFTVTMMSGSEAASKQLKRLGLQQVPAIIAGSLIVAPIGCAVSLPSRVVANLLLNDLRKERYSGTADAVKKLYAAQRFGGFFRCFGLRNAAFSVQLIVVNLLTPQVGYMLSLLPAPSELQHSSKATTHKVQ